jgi:hypothetical protein
MYFAVLIIERKKKRNQISKLMDRKARKMKINFVKKTKTFRQVEIGASQP